MKAELKSIASDEVDLRNFIPVDDGNFQLLIHLKIGVSGTGGADDFELFVCTPKWLENNLKGPTFGRNFLIVSTYNFTALEALIVNHVDSVRGDSWAEIARRLARYFSWEFEDYQH